MSAVPAIDSADSPRVLALAALVAANLLPLLGVLLWHWDVGALVVLYWSENLIIGACTLIKLLVASPVRGALGGLVFVIHYGGFCAVHGVFVMLLAVGQPPDVLQGETWPLLLVFVQLLVDVIAAVWAVAPTEWLVVFAALTVSHGISLALNYFGAGEHRGQTVRSLMTAPYRRITILHVAILAGGFGVAVLGSPMPLLVLLVALKLILDVWLHRRERRTSAAEREVSSTAARS